MTSTDARLRTLKRAAEAGDVEARQRLWEEGWRFGAFDLSKAEPLWRLTYAEKGIAGAGGVDPKALYVARLKLAAFLNDPAALAILKTFGEEKPKAFSAPFVNYCGAQMSALAALELGAFALERWRSEVMAEAYRDPETHVRHTIYIIECLTEIERLRAEGGPPRLLELRATTSWALRVSAVMRYVSASTNTFSPDAPAWTWREVIEGETLRRAMRQTVERITERTPKAQAEKDVKAWCLGRLLPRLSEGWVP